MTKFSENKILFDVPIDNLDDYKHFLWRSIFSKKIETILIYFFSLFIALLIIKQTLLKNKNFKVNLFDCEAIKNFLMITANNNT